MKQPAENNRYVMNHSFRVIILFACCVLLCACGEENDSTAAPGNAPGAANPSPGTPTPGTANPSPGTPTSPGSASLQLLAANGPHVASVRDSLQRGDPRFRTALMNLEVDAKAALDIKPMSVMDKDVTPPSGDKHDYMSQAPYYWPDPSKSGGKPYIRKDGERNPEIDKITDRAYIQRLARSSFSLALAYFFTGRQEYAEHAAELVRVWFLDAPTRMNPNLNFGQGIPGIAEGRAAGIVETRFLPQIIDAVTLLQGSSAWTSAEDARFKGWMRDYLDWLEESRLGRDESTRGNNQETWYDVQVAALAIYTGQDEVARATLRRAQVDIGDEFERDGRQPRELERARSWDYSIFDLTAFLQLAALGERVGVDLWNYQAPNGGSLRKGVDFLVPFATGEKSWPFKQITPLRRSALHPVLRMAAVGWKDSNYRAIAQQIGGGTAMLDLTLP
jgi:hypothetical protein